MFTKEQCAVSQHYLTAGTKIFYYFKRSEQNVLVEWQTGIANKTHPQFLKIITDKNHKTTVAYEDVRLKPNDRLSQELMDV